MTAVDLFTPATCPTCGHDLSTTDSDLFCSEEHQTAWYRARVHPLELPASCYSVTPVGDVVRAIGGPVPTREQIAAMHTRVRRLIPSSEETLAALARVAAGLRRLA